MKINQLLHFSAYGLKTIMKQENHPILGTIILTDKCNLKCKHCAVSNITEEMYPYSNVISEMEKLYKMGVRILFFSGGEIFMWKDSGKTINDLIKRAKNMGFLIVNIVTNGTYPIYAPEADLIMISLDGDKRQHDLIRGECFDKIMDNIHSSHHNNLLLYMALNKYNHRDIQNVCDYAENISSIRGVSFNFHTPHPGTEYLSLSKSEKKECCDAIAKLKKQGKPVFNLTSAFPYICGDSGKKPCRQCVVVEKGQMHYCGRCINIDGLCKDCGYFFAAEYTLLFRGNLKVILDMLITYPKYIRWAK